MPPVDDSLRRICFKGIQLGHVEQMCPLLSKSNYYFFLTEDRIEGNMCLWWHFLFVYNSQREKHFELKQRPPLLTGDSNHLDYGACWRKSRNLLIPRWEIKLFIWFGSVLSILSFSDYATPSRLREDWFPLLVKLHVASSQLAEEEVYKYSGRFEYSSCSCLIPPHKYPFTSINSGFVYTLNDTMILYNTCHAWKITALSSSFIYIFFCFGSLMLQAARPASVCFMLAYLCFALFCSLCLPLRLNYSDHATLVMSGGQNH